MADRHDISLREVEANDPPGLLARIKDQLQEHLPAALGDGSSWLRGRSRQELAKAEEIRARVIAELGSLENARLRLIHDREQARESHKLDQRQAELGHRERMYDLRTQRLRALTEAIAALKELASMGVEVQLDVVAAKLLSMIDED